MWSRRSIEIFAGATLLAALAACSVSPRQTDHAWTKISAARPGASPAAESGQAAADKGTPRAATPPPPPAEASAAFDQALALARAGNNDAAETQLQALARRYPQFSTPLLDLGILYRKGGNLDAAARALQQALARDPHDALAWTELGVVQRLGGQFQDAERSYSRAIAANPAYAPAYRDRGVLRDLYLDQPAAALADFEQYRKLAAGDKPVVMWIAELQHRTGVKAPPQARN
jgi:tetratricopeptide (TPR) repeat protein